MKKLPDKIRARLVHFYKTAEKYGERIDSHDESAYQEYVSFVERFVKKKDKVLDLGCGTGLSTSMLGRLAGEVNGVDISPIFIKTAEKKRRATNIKFTCADILNLPFPDESYDVVSSFLLIEHIYDIPQALSEMARVAKKGGLIIILSPNLLSPFAELYNLAESIFIAERKPGSQKRHNPFKACWLAIYNAFILLTKNIRKKEDFIYRLPVLENRFDVIPDNDAVYLSNPVDLKFWFKRNGLDIIKYQHETKWGKIFPCFATGIHIVARKQQ